MRQSNAGFGYSPLRVIGEFLLVGALLAALVWGGLAAIRAVAVRAVRRLPRSVDARMGAAEAARVRASEHVCAGAALKAAVGEIAARVAKAGGVGDVTVAVVRDEDVNAFALPGGAVFVNSGLLAKVERPEELAGVLGHELGHVALRHGLVSMAQNVGLTQAVALVFGADDAVDLLLRGASNLGALAYSREMESEADDFSVATLVRAGIDPSGLPAFFARMDRYAFPAWLATHPDPAARAARLRATTGGVTTTVALPALDRLRAACE